jgi:hypothetical protein
MPTRKNTKRHELHKVVIRITYLRTTVARVVASRATTLSVTTPGTLAVTQARGTPRSPPLQETDALVVGTTEVLMEVGAAVRPAEPLTLAMLETPAPREAVSIPPLEEGRTPAFKVTPPAVPRATVTHRSRRAPEHDEEMPV